MSRLTTDEQITFLQRIQPSFTDRLISSGYKRLAPAASVQILQINVGKWCNQACRHCHVDAGPLRKETMSQEVAAACMQIAATVPSIDTVDLTGGATEGHEVFKYLVTESRRLGKKVIDRCNLTILFEPEFEWLPDFFVENQVELVASLPHFSASRTDSQRGKGVFDKSMEALKLLNSLGYGIKKELPLYLVYNPSGAFLSGNQMELEREFRTELSRRHGIQFTGLYALNNLPVSRFLEALVRQEKLDEYMELLTDSFNPGTIDGLMCRHQISVGWDGKIYDCDFNQMLELPSESAPTVFDFNPDTFSQRTIVTYDHCFGCTAGAGSSCGGSLQ